MDSHQLRDYSQYARIKIIMEDGNYRTLKDIGSISGDLMTCISAQLRALRQDGYVINKRYNSTTKLWEYKLIIDKQEVDNATITEES